MTRRAACASITQATALISGSAHSLRLKVGETIKSERRKAMTERPENPAEKLLRRDRGKLGAPTKLLSDFRFFRISFLAAN